MTKIIVCRVGADPVVEDHELTLKAMQQIVGGYVECVAIAPGLTLWCNEDGKNLPLPFNRHVAIQLPAFPVPAVLAIVGDFFVAHETPDGFFDVTPEDIDLVKSRLTF